MTTLFSNAWDTTGNIVSTQTDGGGFEAKAFAVFSLADDSSITDVHWTGGYQNPASETSVTGFIIQFWSNVAGAPGVQLQTETVPFANCNQTSVGSTLPGPTFVNTYSVDLVTPFAATGGTTYWLMIEAQLTFPPTWGWCQDGAGTATTYQDFGGFPLTYDTKRAFDLTGSSTPPPPACPNTATTTILEDGPRNTVLEFFGQIGESDLAQTIVVNAANEYSDPVNPTNCYRVDRIDYDMDDGITVNLYWGGVPTPFAHLSGRGIFDAGTVFGGFQNNEDLSVRDGRILADTTGWSSGCLFFSLTLWLVKQAFPSASTPSFYLLEDGSGVYLLEDGSKFVQE